MSDDREEYEGDLLTQANNLNGAIKEYLATGQNNRDALESFKTDIFGYLVDIDSEEFEPRADRLTKAGIELDLNAHLTTINGLLARGTGKRRKGTKRSRKSRRSNKRKRSSRKRSSRKKRKY
jgi:hypothetical protein